MSSYWHAALLSTLLVVPFLLLRWRLIRRARQQQNRRRHSVRTLVFLGSGGHTGEMIALLSAMSGKSGAEAERKRQRYEPLEFVLAASDVTSEKSVRARLPEVRVCACVCVNDMFRGSAGNKPVMPLCCVLFQ